MSFFKNKENLLVLCIIALVLFLSLGRNRTQALPVGAISEISTEESATEAFIYIHLTGRIRDAGVVRLPAGSRLQDAVEAAGGLFPDADATQINLSMKLKDEDKIHIPALGERPQGTAGVHPIQDGLVDINQADQSELEQLPGIGPALAQRIIEHREESPFSSIEEIQNVRGIGEKLFEGMKEQITVR